MVSSGDAQKRRAWKARFARYRSSGLSVAGFCKQEGVSTNTFYYWAKRLRTASAPASSRTDRAFPPRNAAEMPSPDSNTRGAMVRFHGTTGVEVSVPADCLEAIRCLAECLAKAGDHRSEAFQEVVVKA
jgi:transposase-like protein